MSGIQEILVLVLIVLAIFFLPRIVSRASKSGKTAQRPFSMVRRLSVRMRFAVLASAVWPLGAALFFNPLSGRSVPFLYIGVVPVLLAWGIGWVVAGYRRGPRQNG